MPDQPRRRRGLASTSSMPAMLLRCAACGRQTPRDDLAAWDAQGRPRCLRCDARAGRTPRALPPALQRSLEAILAASATDHVPAPAPHPGGHAGGRRVADPLCAALRDVAVTAVASLLFFAVLVLACVL